MKKQWLLGLLLGCTTPLYALTPGPYLGIQAGISDTNNVQKAVEVPSGTKTVSPDNTGLGLRVFTGYGFNRTFSLEGAYFHFAPSIYETDESPVCGDPRIHTFGFDLAGKGTFALSDNFDVYAKAGIAFVARNSSGRLQTPTLNSCDENEDDVFIRPLFGFGLAYNFSKSLAFDVSVSRITSGGRLQAADYYALGLTYSFGDTVCGQFLC